MSYTTEKHDKVTFYTGEDGGFIMLMDGGISSVWCAPKVGLSRLTNGERNKDLVAFMGDAGAEIVTAIYISYLRRMNAPELPLVMRGLAVGLSEEHRRAFAEAALESNYYEKAVMHWLSAIFAEAGGAGMKVAGEFIDKVERKCRTLESEELTFLKCVESVAEKIGGVPTQKDVFAVWEDPDLRVNYNTFRGIRDRLGFSWLPTGKRGRKAIGTEGYQGN